MTFFDKTYNKEDFGIFASLGESGDGGAEFTEPRKQTKPALSHTTWRCSPFGDIVLKGSHTLHSRRVLQFIDMLFSSIIRPRFAYYTE